MASAGRPPTPALGAPAVDEVVVEPLDPPEIDLPDVHGAEVGAEVDLDLDPVGACRALRGVALEAALEGDLDLTAQPHLREAVEGNGVRLAGRLRVEGAEEDLRVDLVRDAGRQALVGRGGTDALLDALGTGKKLSIRIVSMVENNSIPEYGSRENANPVARPQLRIH